MSATKPAAKDKNLLSACDVIPLSLFSEYVVLCWSVGQNGNFPAPSDLPGSLHVMFSEQFVAENPIKTG